VPQYFDEALRLSQLADELGYSHVRTVEHYFRSREEAAVRS
jgi:hypothetical protein